MSVTVDESRAEKHVAFTPLISFGIGVDLQHDGVYVNNAPATYFALNVDAFVEYPFSVEDELLLKLNVFYYAHGRTLVPESSALPNGGAGFSTPLGCLNPRCRTETPRWPRPYFTEYVNFELSLG